MTIEEIRENAPSGATGYTHEDDFSIVSYWRVVNNKVESFSDEDDNWIKYHNCESFHDYIKGIMKPL